MAKEQYTIENPSSEIINKSIRTFPAEEIESAIFAFFSHGILGDHHFTPPDVVEQTIEQCVEKGILPYSARYLGYVKEYNNFQPGSEAESPIGSIGPETLSKISSNHRKMLFDQRRKGGRTHQLFVQYDHYDKLEYVLESYKYLGEKLITELEEDNYFLDSFEIAAGIASFPSGIDINLFHNGVRIYNGVDVNPTLVLVRYDPNPVFPANWDKIRSWFLNLKLVNEDM